MTIPIPVFGEPGGPTGWPAKIHDALTELDDRSVSNQAALATKQDAAALGSDVAALLNDPASSPRAALWGRTGKHPLTGMFHVDAYGADPTGVSNSDTAWAAVMTDVNAAGGRVYAPGKYAVSTGVIVIANDNVRIVGDVLGESQITGTGTGAVIDYDPTAVRRNCGLSDLRVTAATAGGTCYKVQNAYRGQHERCKFDSALGTAGVAVNIAGSATTSTHFNTFMDCEANGTLNALLIDDNANGNRWIGGVLEGAGRSVYIPATNIAADTNTFIGVGIQATGDNTGGVIVELGGPTYGARYSSFIGCRFESSAAQTIKFNSTAWYNQIIGGSMAGSVTVNDLTTGTLNTVMVTGGSLNPSRFAWPLSVRTSIISEGTITGGYGTAAALAIGGSHGALQAAGTGTNQNLYLASKGTGAVSANAFNGDGTGGLSVYSGGAASALRAAVGGGDVFDAFAPSTSGSMLRGRVTGDAQARLRISAVGKMDWSDGANAPDVSLYRSAADVLKTDDSFKTGASTTAARPSASALGAGAQWFDTTLNKPIWSNGTDWVDATGATV